MLRHAVLSAPLCEVLIRLSFPCFFTKRAAWVSGPAERDSVRHLEMLAVPESGALSFVANQASIKRWNLIAAALVLSKPRG